VSEVVLDLLQAEVTEAAKATEEKPLGQQIRDARRELEAAARNLKAQAGINEAATAGAYQAAQWAAECESRVTEARATNFTAEVAYATVLGKVAAVEASRASAAMHLLKDADMLQRITAGAVAANQGPSQQARTEAMAALAECTAKAAANIKEVRTSRTDTRVVQAAAGSAGSSSGIGKSIPARVASTASVAAPAQDRDLTSPPGLAPTIAPAADPVSRAAELDRRVAEVTCGAVKQAEEEEAAAKLKYQQEGAARWQAQQQQHRQAVEAAQLQFKHEEEEAAREEKTRWEASHAATAANGWQEFEAVDEEAMGFEQPAARGAGLPTAAPEPAVSPAGHQAAPEGPRRNRSRSRSPVQPDRSSTQAVGGEKIAVPE
jgi:hypothetical protein